MAGTGAPLAYARALRTRLVEETARAGGDPADVPSVPQLLDLRQRLAGLASPAGHAVSATGACRLLRAADGWVAVNLPRSDDLELLPAWLAGAGGGDGELGADGDVPWPRLAAIVSRLTVAGLVAQAALLGLAVAAVPPGLDPLAEDEQLRARGTTDVGRPFVVSRVGPVVAPGGADRAGDGRDLPEAPLVVDLSSLWAGPLCGRLLAGAGHRVVKVESTTRPDGARGGPPAVFDWLNGAKEHVALPLSSEEGRRRLRGLLAAADVVIEASRPRALAQMGIDPAEVVGARPGVVWVAVTGYGRTGPWADRVGFGDDGAAAGALLGSAPDGSPVFAGDAVADPLTGLTAAVLALAARRAGGGLVVDVSLREVARSAAAGAGGAVAAVDLGLEVER